MKILCMCQRGNVRSAALAFLLKDYYGHDAVAIGWETAGVELKGMLFPWADLIVVLEPYMLDHVPEPHLIKTRVADVGPDGFGSPRHPVLLTRLEDHIRAGRIPLAV